MLYDVVNPRRLSTRGDRFRPVISLRGELPRQSCNMTESRLHKDEQENFIERSSPPEADRPRGLPQPGSL